MKQKYLVLAFALFFVQCKQDNVEPNIENKEQEIEFRSVQSPYAYNQLVVYLENPALLPNPDDVISIEECPCNENLQLWTFSDAALQQIPIEERRRNRSNQDSLETGFNVQLSVQNTGFDFPITPNNFVDGISRIHPLNPGRWTNYFKIATRTNRFSILYHANKNAQRQWKF